MVQEHLMSPKDEIKSSSAEKSGDVKTSKNKRKIKVDVSSIKNKIKRQEVYSKVRQQKKTEKKERRSQRTMQIEKLGSDALRPKPKTLDNMREADETLVQAQDPELAQDEAIDEFSSYFKEGQVPKICITTCPRIRKGSSVLDFVQDLLKVFPNSFYYQRRNFEIKEIIPEAVEKGFTDLMVINDDSKEINSLLLIHLPYGPTALFKISSVVLSRDIPGKGKMSSHEPEIILNNFNTRLGHRIGRMLASLVHQKPNFHGRRVVTFHNQRDFIFFRQHRYVFEDDSDEEAEEKPTKKRKSTGPRKIVRLQELGPQFTLKLKSLQHGTFDSVHGEYEWKHNPELETSRRRFFL